VTAARQLLAAVVTGTGAGVLAIGHLLSTATPDLLAWTVVVRLVVATLKHDRPRLWLAVGLALGIGLENKNLVGFLAAGLVVGIAVTPRPGTTCARHGRGPRAAVAVALWLPNLLWQAQHGWPQLELAGDIRDEYRTPGGTIELIASRSSCSTRSEPSSAAIGARAGVASARWAFFRPVPIAYGVLLVVFAVTGGKNYYLLGLLPPLAAAGSVVVADRRSPTAVRRSQRSSPSTALFPVPALLPVLPVAALDASFYPALNEDGLETIGWPSVVDTVRGVVDDLPAADRRTAVVVTQNYGQAGASSDTASTRRSSAGTTGSLTGAPRTRTDRSCTSAATIRRTATSSPAAGRPRRWPPASTTRRTGTTCGSAPARPARGRRRGPRSGTWTPDRPVRLSDEDGDGAGRRAAVLDQREEAAVRAEDGHRPGTPVAGSGPPCDTTVAAAASTSRAAKAARAASRSGARRGRRPAPRGCARRPGRRGRPGSGAASSGGRRRRGRRRGPRASARTYVPLEQTTCTSTSRCRPRPAQVTDVERSHVTGRAASSTSSPARTRLYDR
jgi:hypothetical protein